MFAPSWLHVQVEQDLHDGSMVPKILEKVSGPEPAVDDGRQEHRTDLPLPAELAEGP